MPPSSVIDNQLTNWNIIIKFVRFCYSYVLFYYNLWRNQISWRVIIIWRCPYKIATNLMLAKVITFSLARYPFHLMQCCLRLSAYQDDQKFLYQRWSSSFFSPVLKTARRYVHKWNYIKFVGMDVCVLLKTNR